MAKPKRTPEEQYAYMTETPVSRLIMAFAVPSMFTQLITSIYNLADTFFVGRIGTSASAAVGVVFSINMVLMALGFWVGSGGSTLVSNLLGAQETEKAQRINSTAFWLSFFFGLLVAAVTVLGGAPLLRLLGATETIVPYARDYAVYLMLGAPFSSSSLMLGQCLRAEGMSKESMYGNVIGGVLNMILDPLFIFGLNLGIRGAAIATAISQFVNWAILIRYYLLGRTRLTLDIRHVSRQVGEYVQLFTVGFPSLCRHTTNMLANVVLNSVAGSWGDAAIAAMSICNRILFLSNAVCMGLNNGAQPVIGYAYGAKKYRRVKDAFAFNIRISVISMVGFGAVMALFAPQLVGFFREDAEVIRYGTSALRLICLAMPFACLYNSTTVLFQIIKKPAISSGVMLTRQLVLYIPFLLILPGIWGVVGMQAAGPAADILVGLAAIPLVSRLMRSITQE